jgi:CubicO group peptidase (beta-lactamase class C family)
MTSGDGLIAIAQGELASAAELLVLQGGEVRHHAASGAEAGQTRFILYSISKMITLAAVLRLTDAGKLSLQSRVADLIPEFAAGGKGEVRIEEVLTHSSGFPAIPGFEGEGRALELEDLADWDHFVQTVCSLPLQPHLRGLGVYHALSYGVLGAVVERASGLCFDDFCRAEVLDPLGMASTTWGLPAQLRVHSAGFHGPAAGPWREAHLEDLLVPAGGAWSTAEDVARLLLMLRDHGMAQGSRFLSEAVVDEARRPRVPVPDGGWSFGLGLFVNGDAPVFARGSRTARGTFGHSGAMANQAFHDPEADLTLICLTNSCVTQEESDARFNRLCDEVYARYARWGRVS